MSSVRSTSIRDQRSNRNPALDQDTDRHTNQAVPSVDAGHKAMLEAKLRTARTDLLDLTLRNNMLNFRLPKTKGLNLKDQRVDLVFDRLVRQHGTLVFAPAITEDTATGTSSDEPTTLVGPYTSEQLQTRLLQTYRTARTYIEEQGANTLFLAMSFLEWYESDSSDKPLLAPLVLVPVLLERDATRDRFTLKYTDEEVVDNLSLNTE